MSRKYNTNPADAEDREKTAAPAGRENDDAEPEAAATVQAEQKQPASRVYCGPTVRGVAKRYTVYIGEIPAPLADFLEQNPEAKALTVPVERFAETRAKVETAGTAEAILYHKIESKL